MSACRCLTNHTAGKLKKTGRTVEGYPAIILDLQTFEVSGQIKLIPGFIMLGLLTRATVILSRRALGAVLDFLPVLRLLAL